MININDSMFYVKWSVFHVNMANSLVDICLPTTSQSLTTITAYVEVWVWLWEYSEHLTSLADHVEYAFQFIDSAYICYCQVPTPPGDLDSNADTTTTTEVPQVYWHLFFGTHEQAHTDLLVTITWLSLMCSAVRSHLHLALKHLFHASVVFTGWIYVLCLSCIHVVYWNTCSMHQSVCTGWIYVLCLSCIHVVYFNCYSCGLHYICLPQLLVYCIILWCTRTEFKNCTCISSP